MTRSSQHGLRVEDAWPNGLAPTTFHAPWDLHPEPPFRIQRWHEAPPGWTRGEWRTFGSLGEAITAFVEWPVELGMSAVLLDEGFNVILGWTGIDVVIRSLECPVWYGVRAAFEWMENSGRFDPMEILDHEITAMASAT